MSRYPGGARPAGRRGWRRIGAAIGAVAIAATSVTTAAGADEGPSATDDGAADVGSLSTSWVEMLASGGSGSTVMSLADLRATVANYSGLTSAGTGIDVAVIDTGVAPVSGLDRAGKVLHGPDLSFEAASPQAAYLDTYGHGTHMAGIIAGERSDAPGIAPGARIVSVKVAGHDGITTVPQVVAAIDWVVEHRNTDGLNIRVLNLSLGQADVPSHVGDALSAAVERAWGAGIFVVVAAGNGGSKRDKLDSPAIDPFVLAVGAAAVSGPYGSTTYAVPDWSARGNGSRRPDVVAPGVSIASYRVPGSTIDVSAPQARLGDHFFLGTGSSQSAAVMSGVAAAMIQRRPWMSNDAVKSIILGKTTPVEKPERSGKGAVDAVASVLDRSSTWVVPQSFPKAAGSGTGILAPTGATWSGGKWSGATWSGATWSGTVWSGATWSGATWSGATWSGATWSGATWSGATWSGATWSGATWSGATWSGATWSGQGWS